MPTIEIVDQRFFACHNSNNSHSTSTRWNGKSTQDAVQTSITALCPHMNFRPQVTGNCPASHPDEQCVDHGDRPSEMGVVSSENFRVCCRCHELQESTFLPKLLCFLFKAQEFKAWEISDEQRGARACHGTSVPAHLHPNLSPHWNYPSMKVHIALVTDKVFVAKLWEAFKPISFGNWLSTTALKVDMSNLKNKSDKIRETNGKQRQLLANFQISVWPNMKKIIKNSPPACIVRWCWVRRIPEISAQRNDEKNLVLVEFHFIEGECLKIGPQKTLFGMIEKNT